MELVVDSASRRTSLPFGYAQQHGVLLEEGDDNPVVVHQGKPGASVLAEVRRFLRVPFSLQAVSEEEFQRRLTLAYQRGNNEAVQMAEDISSDVDLSRLADAILREISVNYPLRGEVVAVEPPANAILNIGSNVGLEMNSLLNVLPPDKEDPRLVLARIRVSEVDKDRATGQVLNHSDLVTPGCRVLEAAEPTK